MPLRPPRRRFVTVTAAAVAAALASTACATSSNKTAALAPLAVAAEIAEAKPAPLVEDHFTRDHLGALPEDKLREILRAPVFLEDKARIGVVPVAEGYGADGGLPIAGVPGALRDTLDDTGLFDVVSEVSTDFPATGTVAGLRELAARYRADYLLLYRHRFVDDVYASGWAWTWVTLVGPMIAPANVLEAEGVLEATLFDVKTGTILFTTFERIRDKREESVLDTERKQKRLKEKMLVDATRKIGEQVVSQVQRLAAARPADASAQLDAATRRAATANADAAEAPVALIE